MLLRDIGSRMSPFNAFQFIQGLETLPLRMREHSEMPQGGGIPEAPSRGRQRHLPALQTGEEQRRADAYLSGGFGALVGFGSRTDET